MHTIVRQSISSSTIRFKSNAGQCAERPRYQYRMHKLTNKTTKCPHRPYMPKQAAALSPDAGAAVRIDFCFTWILRYAHISRHECRGRVEKGGCVSFEIQLVCRERDLHSGRCRQPAEAQLIGIMSGRFRMSTDHTWPNWIGDTGFPVDAISATSKISLAGCVCVCAQHLRRLIRISRENRTKQTTILAARCMAVPLEGTGHHNHDAPFCAYRKSTQ